MLFPHTLTRCNMSLSSRVSLVVTICLLAVGSIAYAADNDEVTLFETDFSDLNPGKFGQLAENSFPEYHHVERTYTGQWELVSNRYPLEWTVLELEDNHSLNYMGYHKKVWFHNFIYPMLCAGSRFWGDYDFETEVTFLSHYEAADWMGVFFRYQDGRHYYYFGAAENDKLVLIYRDGEKGFDQDGWVNLKEKNFHYDRTKKYNLKVSAWGESIKCYVDGELVFDVKDSRYKGGKIGLLAASPVRYHNVNVSTTMADFKKFKAGENAFRAQEDSLRRINPKPVIWKRIPTPGFGSDRALRMGDMDGDGKLDFLVAQNTNFLGRNFNDITCMTALNTDGKILWQKGTPNPDNTWSSYDVSMQIHDIDDDGQNEVIYALETDLIVVDGKTGKEERRMPLPRSDISEDEISWLEYEHFYRRDRLPYLSVDCISFADLRGTGKPLDIIIKDRHTRLWAYDNNFNLLWTATANMGHFPHYYDIDRDGKDEVYLGYTLFDDDGSIIWNHDTPPNDYKGKEFYNDFPPEERFQEHSDGVVVGDFSLSGKPEIIFYGASDDGVIILDNKGRLLKHYRVGHAQTPTVGNYRPDIPGLEFCNINFWGEPGIITIYDCYGNEVTNFEPFHSGSPVLPVNWRGDGSEFFILSTNPTMGGMVDGWGRRAVMFPEDGHPDRAYVVEDMTGDARDEIITWEPDWIYIYTQDEPFEGDSIYAPDP